ncbi:hypothetical protein AD940_03575 [Gluconobacter thailandicus]|nr:hypothetical protein AD940_03575 [Gluconobacter thailandicus]
MFPPRQGLSLLNALATFWEYYRNSIILDRLFLNLSLSLAKKNQRRRIMYRIRNIIPQRHFEEHE